MKNKVVLCGCGWLGLYLARVLPKDLQLIGTTRTKAKADYLATQGIQPLLFTLAEPADQLVELVQDATVMLNIPPGRKNGLPADFANDMCKLIDTLAAAGAAHIIFISTIAVYGDEVSGDINENSPVAPATPSAKAHVAIEQHLRNHAHAPYTIVRLAGLVGPDRHPAKSLAGRQLPEGERVVNLVHVSDVVAALVKILKRGAENELFHFCASEHPRRGDYYPAMARELGVAEPAFITMTGEEAGKRIDASRSWKKLGLSVRYASPYDMV